MGAHLLYTMRIMEYFTFTWSFNGLVSVGGHEYCCVNQRQVIAPRTCRQGSLRDHGPLVARTSITTRLINTRSTLVASRRVPRSCRGGTVRRSVSRPTCCKRRRPLSAINLRRSN